MACDLWWAMSKAQAPFWAFLLAYSGPRLKVPVRPSLESEGDTRGRAIRADVGADIPAGTYPNDSADTECG